MSFGHALGLVDALAMDCFIFNLDFDRTFAQFSWESNWVNMIRFKKLKRQGWSFGMAGLTVDTAQDEAVRLRAKKFPIPDFLAHELIANEELNLFLGCGQMRYLLDKYHGDTDKAERAYNAGCRGVKRGLGSKYPTCVFKSMLDWQMFEQSRPKAE